MDPYYSLYKKYKAKYREVVNQDMMGGTRTRYSPYNPYTGQHYYLNESLHANNLADELYGESGEGNNLDSVKASILEKAQHIHGELESVKHLISYLNHFDVVQDMNTPSEFGGRNGSRDFGESLNKELLEDETLIQHINSELSGENHELVKNLNSKKYGKNLGHALIMSGNYHKLRDLSSGDNNKPLFDHLSQSQTLAEAGPKYDKHGNLKDRTPLESKKTAISMKLKGLQGEEKDKEQAKLEAVNKSIENGSFSDFNDYTSSQEGGFWSWLFE